MSALDKFKSLFGEKAKGQTPHQKRPNHLKEVKAEGSGQSQGNREKAEVEILQKKIRAQLTKDPKLQKKAAMIIENMIKGKEKGNK